MMPKVQPYNERKPTPNDEALVAAPLNHIRSHYSVERLRQVLSVSIHIPFTRATSTNYLLKYSSYYSLYHQPKISTKCNSSYFKIYDSELSHHYFDDC